MTEPKASALREGRHSRLGLAAILVALPLAVMLLALAYIEEIAR